MNDTKLKELLYDIDREKDLQKVQQLITKHVLKKSGGYIDFNATLEDKDGKDWRYELFLKSKIESMAGGEVSVSNVDFSPYPSIFNREYKFTEVQLGYARHIESDKIVAVKFKTIEVSGYVSDDKEVPCSYRIGPDEITKWKENDCFREFDPDKEFLTTYITQQYNKSIQDLFADQDFRNWHNIVQHEEFEDSDYFDMLTRKYTSLQITIWRDIQAYLKTGISPVLDKNARKE